MRRSYIKKQFRDDTLALLQTCNDILSEYSEEGYALTLRQLYYQLVSRDLIANTVQEYSKLGTAISNGRLAGFIDWEMIIDRGRETLAAPYWKDPQDFLDSVCPQFAIDVWKTQPVHVEVMCEKQALEGIVAPVCRELNVPFSSNKGYVSQSFLWRKSQEFLSLLLDGKVEIILLYLGDHDPSGLDMDRDLLERLETFLREDGCRHEQDAFEDRIQVTRVALTREQIHKYNPPPNPAKLTDSRAGDYIKEHGPYSWELDSLEPRVLTKMVRLSIMAFIDDDLWSKAQEKEQRMYDSLRDMTQRIDGE